MPRLWSETIAAHRRDVRDAILDAAAALAAEHGLLSVTMSQIAEQAGIGRATLYKYFGDVETILRAWHERQISGHLAELEALRARRGTARDRLAAVLEGYAARTSGHGAHDAELVAFFHSSPELARGQRHLHALLATMLAEGAASGEVRDDVSADELATYCLHALGAAGALRSAAAVRRLVAVVLAGLSPPTDESERPGRDC